MLLTRAVAFLCLGVVALTPAANAFHIVSSPHPAAPAVDVPALVSTTTTERAICVTSVSSAAATKSTLTTTQTSSLPSQKELLGKVGSFALAASAAPAPASAAPVPKPADAKPVAVAVAVAVAAPATQKPANANGAKAATGQPAKTTGNNIRIDDVRYDGAVPKTESDEYVVIGNSSKNPADVSGYVVYPVVAATGNRGSAFAFPKGSTIEPRSSVRIYTNEVHEETGGYSWGSGRALWNNGGGLAVLKNADGKTLGEFKY